MAAQLYYSAFIPAFSSNGLPVPGAFIYFFMAGTNDLAPIYSDETLSTPLANPVQADLAARFPNVYLDENVIYRVRLTDALGTPLGADVDPYIPGAALRGPPGAPDNSYNTLALFKASDINKGKATLFGISGIPNGDFYWTLGNYTGKADDVNVIKADSTSLAVGAWVRQSAAGVTAKASPNGVERNLASIITDRTPLTPYDFGAVGGGANDYVAFNAAVQAAFTERRELLIPAGNWRVDSSIQVRIGDYLSYLSAFGTAPRILGEGQGKTVIDFRGTGALFDIDSNAAHTALNQGFYYGLEIGNLTIRRAGGSGNASAIRLRSAYQPHLHDLSIIGMSQNGIELICSTGDYDACNMPALERLRIENCPGWGIVIGEPGHNETSFVGMDKVFIQSCGTDMGSLSMAPTSGGMRWSGQILKMTNCATTLCRNVPLYIPGQPGAAQSWFVDSTTYENNYRRAGPLIGGLSGGGGTFQMYSNDLYQAERGLELDGSVYAIKQLEFTRIVVRATAGNNAMTQFKLSGSNTMPETIRVRNTIWDNFDYPGQTRFDGFRFDPVIKGCSLLVASSTSLVLRPDGTGRGNYTPIRLRGTGSTSGEWVATDISSLGVGVSNAGLAASTRYYVYLWDNNNVKSLELSTTGPTVDSLSGYLVKTGDATRAYQGSVETDASILFKLTGGGWLDPLRVPGTQVGVFNYLWNDATGKLRSKTSLPTSDTDGTVVGTQT